MAAAYAESESMALKRLRVALKRKDWQMFEYGLSRTEELIKSGNKISEIQEWYKIHDIAKAEKIPDELLNKLTGLTENILSPSTQTQTHTLSSQANQTTDTTTYTQPKIMPSMGKVRAPRIPFVVFIDNTTNVDTTKIAQELRFYINKLSVDPDSSIEPGLLSQTAKLINNLDKPYQELNGIETLLENYPNPGIIITTFYDCEIIKTLNKHNIEYSIDEVKKASKDAYWKLYPLAGLLSIYYCPTCGTRSFHKNTQKAVISICKKCSAAAYPDIYPIDINNPQTNPKYWYMAYQALVNSENWLLISPPNAAENPIVSRLLIEASKDAIISNAYIVSNKSEIGSWWRNTLEENISDCNVAPVCFNVEILINNYIKLPKHNTNE